MTLLAPYQTSSRTCTGFRMKEVDFESKIKRLSMHVYYTLHARCVFSLGEIRRGIHICILLSICNNIPWGETQKGGPKNSERDIDDERTE
jgi:hypothetical protein